MSIRRDPFLAELDRLAHSRPLTVHADDSDWAKRARTILDRFGAKGIDQTGEATGDADQQRQQRHV
jgi:hypothetical protein